MFNLYKKFRNLFTTVNEIERTIKTQARLERLYVKALKSSDKLTSNEGEVVISFTTYNIRINYVHLMIESIGEQTVKPKRLILWLDEDEFNIGNIPAILKNQVNRGLEIKFCKNYRSYKKLIPTLLENPNEDIVTVDDDIIYPHDMLELLIKESKLYPNTILAHRAHKITLNKKTINLYKSWEHDCEYKETSELIFPVGVGGVFYPSGCFHKECINVEKFMELAPNADDVWFKFMSYMNGIKSKKVGYYPSFWEQFLVIPDGQNIALSVNNVDCGGNDKQINAVINVFFLNFEGVSS